MRQFYEMIEETKWNTMRSKLSWSHYREVLKLKDINETIFYLDEVLDILKNSKIYRTVLNGSIEIKLNKNGYKIRTCPP